MFSEWRAVDTAQSAASIFDITHDQEPTLENYCIALLEKVDNLFRLVTVTSKRARQIAAGSTPLTKKDEPSPVSLAADEIAEGKVKPC